MLYSCWYTCKPELKPNLKLELYFFLSRYTTNSAMLVLSTHELAPNMKKYNNTNKTETGNKNSSRSNLQTWAIVLIK